MAREKVPPNRIIYTANGFRILKRSEVRSGKLARKYIADTCVYLSVIRNRGPVKNLTSSFDVFVLNVLKFYKFFFSSKRRLFAQPI